MVVDHRRLPDLIDAEGDRVLHAARNDLDATFLSVQGEWHGEDCLQRVALGAAVRRDIGFAARGPGVEIQDRGHGLGRDASPVVAHPNPATRDRHTNRRPSVGFLAGVQRVVDQLLKDHQRPRFRLVPGLCHQLLAAAELEEPARAERRAFQARDGRHHESSQTRHRSAASSGSNGLR